MNILLNMPGIGQLIHQLKQVQSGLGGINSAAAGAARGLGGGVGPGAPKGFNLSNLPSAIVRASSGSSFGAASVLSMMAKFGQAGLVLGLVIAGLYAGWKAIAFFHKILQQAAERVDQWSKAFWFSGASEAGARGVTGIAAALGVSTESIASAAGRKPGGSSQLIQQLKSLMSIKDDRAAFFMARSLGLEHLLPMRDLGRASQKEAVAGTGVHSYNQDDRGILAEYKYAWGKFTQNFTGLLSQLALPILQTLTPFLNKLAADFKTMAEIAAEIQRYMNLPKKKLREWLGLDKDDKAKKDFKDSVDKFSDAVGIFGGNQQGRAAKAFPPGWAWYGIQQSLMNDARGLGAFSL